jgi:RNA polymerase sigma-70 factor (ECF subfamily)
VAAHGQVRREVRTVLGDSYAAALEGARRGDEQAFALLYRDIHPNLLRYLRGMSVELAEDAASETWLEAARSLDSFEGPEAAFRGWLFAIARRKLIDRVRYESRRPSSAWDEVEDAGPVQRDIAEDVVELDATDRALALVRTLPPDQAEAVLLRVVAGLDYPGVAEVMGRSTGAVRVLVHRGLKRLGRELGDRTLGRGGVTP